MIYMWCTYKSCEASHHPTRLINYGNYRKNYVVNTKLNRRFGLNRSRLPILVETDDRQHAPSMRTRMDAERRR